MARQNFFSFFFGPLLKTFAHHWCNQSTKHHNMISQASLIILWFFVRLHYHEMHIL